MARFDTERQKRVSDPGSWQAHGVSGQRTTGLTWNAPLMSTSPGWAPRPEMDS